MRVRNEIIFGVIQVLSIKSVGLFLIYCNVVVTVKGKKNVTVCSDFSTLQSPSLSARKWDLLGTHSPLRADGIVSVTLFESRHEGTVPVTYDNECPEFQTVCPGFCAHLLFSYSSYRLQSPWSEPHSSPESYSSYRLQWRGDEREKWQTIDFLVIIFASLMKFPSI